MGRCNGLAQDGQIQNGAMDGWATVDRQRQADLDTGDPDPGPGLLFQILDTAGEQCTVHHSPGFRLAGLQDIPVDLQGAPPHGELVRGFLFASRPGNSGVVLNQTN